MTSTRRTGRSWKNVAVTRAGALSVALTVLFLAGTSCKPKTDISADDAGSLTSLGNATGARLKARTYVAEDGAKEFVGWHDTQLNLDCTIREDPVEAAGALRCLPPYAIPEQLFADAACTQPLAGFPPELGVPTIAMTCTRGGGCVSRGSVGSCDCDGPATQIRSITGPYTGPLYAGGNGAPCQLLDPAPAGGMTHYLTGAEVPPSTYVAATMQLL